jgi:hypothetical protein
MRERASLGPSSELLGSFFAALTSLLLATVPAARGQGFTLWQQGGFASGDEAGQAVAAAADMNGDGIPDVVAGAWRADPGGLTDAGLVVALSGATGTLLWFAAGSAPNDGLGWAAAGVGDVNGGGFADVAVAAITASPGGMAEAGQVKVFSGLTGAVLYTFDGNAAGDRFGRSVSGAGDLDGDNAPDVVVGAYNADPGGLVDAGTVKVFSGASGGVILTLNGAAADDRFGTAVAGPGDVDGDGTDDLLVGAQLASLPGLTWAGQAYVFSGASGLPIYTFSGRASFDRFGYSVAAPGDVNADGFPDFLVGAWLADPGGIPNAGRSTVFSGANGTVLHDLDGTASFEHLGLFVSAVGDVNGDGRADLLAGAPEYDGLTLATGEGAAKVFSGLTGALLLELDGSAFGDGFGRCVAGPGDVDGDDFPDVFVGAYQACCPPAPTPGPGYARMVSLVGTPPGTSPFGVGCAGTGGAVPKLAVFGGSPTIGNASFGFGISNGLGASLAFPFVGTSSIPAGIPIVGCTLYLAGTIVQFGPAIFLGGAPGAPGAGYAMRPVPIPALPALLGLTLTFQFTAFDPGSPNGLFVFSNALTLTIS